MTFTGLWGSATPRRLVIAVVLCTFTSCNSQSDWDESREPGAQERGNEIVKALENYKLTHGVYPRKLHELVPDTLAGIPDPGIGMNEWEYNVYPDGLKFDLNVYSKNRAPYMFYHSYDSSKKWHVARDD
jgi:hypothetical protein